MLQTIIVLACLAAMFFIGGWMVLFGHRAFRFSGMLFGFIIGVGGVLFAAWQFDFAFDSLPVLIAAPLTGLLLGLFGAFSPIAGAALGGLCVGYLYGVGVASAADTLLGGAIPGLLYTGISVVLIGAAFVFCLIRYRQAKWLTTSLSGSYIAIFGLTLGFTWFMSGGLDGTNPALSGSFIFQLMTSYSMIGPNTGMLMLLAAALIGALGCVVQSHAMATAKEAPAMLDFRSDKDELPGLLDEDDLEDEDAQEDILDDEDEEQPKRRGLFGKRSRSKDWEEDENEDDLLSGFAQKKERRREAEQAQRKRRSPPPWKRRRCSARCAKSNRMALREKSPVRKPPRRRTLRQWRP